MFDTEGVGSNKRYAAHYDRLSEDKFIAALAAKGGLQCLSDRELQLDLDPVTIDPDPKPVLVWVRFYDSAVHVRGWAHRWTSRVVGVKFSVGGREYSTWVWSSAVDADTDPRPVPENEKYKS